MRIAREGLEDSSLELHVQSEGDMCMCSLACIRSGPLHDSSEPQVFS